MAEKLKMEGKAAIVTGATAGIGLAVMKKFAANGAFVIGVGRSSQKCQLAMEEIRQSTSNGSPHFLLADLQKLTDVRRLGAEVKKLLNEHKITALDILVNNAGTFSDHFRLTVDGLETTLAVNHFAGFLLTHECMPILKNSTDARILTTSSNSHYRTSINMKQINQPQGYRFGLWAYKVSKLMNVLFTMEFNRRFQGTNMKAFAVDPGLVNTNIGYKNTAWYSQIVWKYRHTRGTSPDLPAQTFFYLATEKELLNTREYYWKNCQAKKPNHLAYDEKLSRELWLASRSCCGIEDEF